MDKIAIISDIHGNMTALNTVLEDISKRGINRIFCLGDLIYKGANPEIVLDILKQRCEIMLKGNCDDYMANTTVASIRKWSDEKIGKAGIDFLNNLPIMKEFYMSGHLIRLFHSSPYGLEHMYNPMFPNVIGRYKDYEIKSPEMLFENTEFIGRTNEDPIPDIIGYGHIHTPNIVRIKNKTIFNSGSVGFPTEMLITDIEDEENKYSTMASYIILEGNYESKELSSLSLNLVRLPYDIEQEIKALEKSDMPLKDRIITQLKSAINL